MVARMCDPSSQKAEAEELQVPGQLGYIARPVSNNYENNKNEGYNINVLHTEL